MRPCGFMPPGRFCVLMGLLRVMLARSHSPVSLPAAFVSVTRQPTTETEVNMAIINLRDYYPFYTSDCFMEVSEEVAEMFKEFDRKEAAYRLRTYRHKAYYSLDRDDGLEHEAVFVALSPHAVKCSVLRRWMSFGNLPLPAVFSCFTISGRSWETRPRICSVVRDSKLCPYTV